MPSRFSPSLCLFRLLALQPHDCLRSSFAIITDEFKSIATDRVFFFFEYCSVGRTLDEARAEDVDVYSRMILTTIWGIDKVKGWLVLGGGDL